MSRLLFLVVIIAAVYLLLKSYRNRAAGEKKPERSEDMVRCIYCGVHLPKSEGIMVGGHYYCSDAHRRAHQSPGSGDAG